MDKRKEEVERKGGGNLDALACARQISATGGKANGVVLRMLRKTEAQCEALR